MNNKKTTAKKTTIESLVKELYLQRADCMKKTAEIDQVFKDEGIDIKFLDKKFGDKTSIKSKSKTKGKAKTTKNRTHYETSGADFVLDVLSDKGALTTSKLNEEWVASGRKGKCYNTLTDLVKANKIVKNNNPESRGSIYNIADTIANSDIHKTA